MTAGLPGFTCYPRPMATKPKVRNWLAVHAHLRRGAGSHGDKRKACRGRVRR